MSNFSFSKAAGAQQQPKEKDNHLEVKSKGTTDGSSTHANGVHSKPNVPTDRDASREESSFWKDKGNMAFKAKKWEVAADAYSRSIEAEATCVAYANRAMAHLKAGKAAAAEEDCTAALQLQASYLKAWLRRSSARKLLGRQLDAIDDLEQAVRLEPESKSMAADLKALIAEHEAASPLQLSPVTMVIESEGNPRSIPAQQPESGTMPVGELRRAQAAGESEGKAVGTKPAAGRAQETDQALQHPESKQLHEMLPGAACSAAAAESKSANGMSEVNTATRASECRHEEVSPVPLQKEQQAGASPGAKLTSREAPQRRPAAVADTTSSQGDFLGKALAGASAKASLPKEAQLSTSQAQQIADAAAAGRRPLRHNVSPSTDSTGRSHDTAAAAATLASKGLTARTLQPPKTSSEFEKVWKTLRSDPMSQAAYLKMLQGTPLDKLLKHSLTGSVLSSVLSCLLTQVMQTDEDLAVSLLKALQHVPRFEMTMMCLSREDKAVLCSAWDEAASQTKGTGTRADLAALRNQYRL